jgi:hypothetical protein
VTLLIVVAILAVAAAVTLGYVVSAWWLRP